MSPDLRRLETADAQVWAEEFAKVRPDVDQGLMLAWFANAIAQGRSAGMARAKRSVPRCWISVEAQ